MKTYKKLVRWLSKDKDQKSILGNLVDHRGGSLKSYVRRGIFYMSTYEESDEISYISEQIGITVEEFGLTEKNKWLFENGFIIPVLDSRYEVLFYINHDFRRDSSKKYLNIYNDKYNGNELKLKLFGLHNTRKAMKQDRIVVTEGVFDSIRLEDYDIPVVAQLGTAIVPYHKSYYKRFRRIIYIPDNDSSGETAWRKFKKEFPTAEVYRIPGVYGDVDEFGQKSKNGEFEEWVKELQKLGNREDVIAD